MFTTIRRLLGLKPPPHKQVEPFLKFDENMTRMLEEARRRADPANQHPPNHADRHT